jgi:hypothetical protein
MPNLLGYYGMDYIPYLNLVEVLIVSSKGDEVNVFNKYNMESSKRMSISNTNLIVDILDSVCTSFYSILSMGSCQGWSHGPYEISLGLTQ